MQSPEQPVLRDIVLVGGGHSHVGVLRMFAMDPVPGVRLTLICTDVDTPYSGMLPGYVAGHYSFDDVHIDLSRLCVFAQARFYRDEVIGIDRAARKVLCKSRPPVPYDLLSINTGSTPQLQGIDGAETHAVAVKPIPRFNARWLALLERVKRHAGTTTVAVVGGGAGGVELCLAMQWRLRQELTALGRNPDELQFHLFTSGPAILPTHNAGVQARFLRVLRERNVTVHLNAEVDQVGPGRLQTGNGQTLQADEVVFVTRAGGAPWLQATGLELDADGCLRVQDTLQTTRDPLIFAAGDVASMVNFKLEKAGVFAVRMGKPLAANLRRAVAGQALAPYRPQRTWLALISTGGCNGVASKCRFVLGGAGVTGDLLWRWKDWIDRRFMRKFSEFPAMADSGNATISGANKLNATKGNGGVALNSEESLQAISAIAMRCGGCGAKVGATVLSRALGQLHPVDRDDVLIGLKDPDDAAVVRVPPGKSMVHSVDFFRAFIDDPYVFGKVAANHALGDIWAMGGEAQSATAVVTVPPGLEAKTEDVLFQMMSGAMEVLNEANCALVGGHTGEGKELALGFAVNGLIDDDGGDIRESSALRKGGMRPGDLLVLTKPIGTGTLFAAHARQAAKGRWICDALDSMVQSNRSGARILREHGATAATDLTGFGLLGHLVEMTKPSGVDAELHVSKLPLLEGAEECVKAGIVSSLQASNVRLRRALRNQEDWLQHPRYPLIFDPQTAGGLLASVPAERAEACVAALRAGGYPHTAIIGRILAQGDALEPILLTA
ncbi:MAG: selenide, water dikinase SelD [Rhodoferax sp.]